MFTSAAMDQDRPEASTVEPAGGTGEVSSEDFGGAGGGVRPMYVRFLPCSPRALWSQAAVAAEEGIKSYGLMDQMLAATVVGWSAAAVEAPLSAVSEVIITSGSITAVSEALAVRKVPVDPAACRDSSLLLWHPG